MKSHKPTSLLGKIARILPPKRLLIYIGILTASFLLLWGALFLHSRRNGNDAYRDYRDRFYESTPLVNLRDDIWSSEFFAALIVLFLEIPPLFLVDLFVRKKIISSLLMFPLIFVSTLAAIMLIDSISGKIQDHSFGEIVTNSDIVFLESAKIEPVDSNNNKVPDTIKVFLTVNGDDPRNNTFNGLTAFGGVKICISLEAYDFNSLTCEHFFHSENQDELKQERIEIGKKGLTTYVFSVETPVDADLTPYKNVSDLYVMADFIGANAPLVYYTQKVPNTIDFNNFENIGIQKSSNESGLH